jgi:TRAP-type mannitol/chloroaromatic compound transport system substrate-binding protein
MKLAKKIALVTLLIACVAMLGMANGQPAQAAAKKYKLQIQTAVPNASIYFQLIQRMAKRIDDMSAGRLKVEVLPAGAIVPVFEILDAVDKGIVNGGFADPLLVRETSGRTAFLGPHCGLRLWSGPARNHVLAV